MSKLTNKPNFDDLQDKVMENQICKEQMQKSINRIDIGNKSVRNQFDQNRNEKRKSISGVKPSAVYSVDVQDHRQMKYAEGALIGIEMVISEYAKNADTHLIIGGNSLKKIWLDGQDTDLSTLPHSLDDFSSMLCDQKPSKIVYFTLMPYMHVDSVFGFGLYLFDEADNLISKMVYKFFDESIAPENARRLSTPTTFEQLKDRSRPFF
ncbi:hypothetical protein ACWPO4_04875 [Acinetobacter nosocomialis]|uniref:hypothetical protein n=1 Tax=Acinetobacter calcoaceticus/baumannii complex TaxID=909768 RepID=UPI0004533355|nr:MULTISPECIES: hypothetical protein [Acinetobacter calcoaceticus/baumannii complex]EXR29134.1 hypothetical protein J689_3055 [Acinetobacter sp. 1179249]MBJ8463261.1 hypothetical protein [Acinetobacter nosocomialis]MBP1499121.1 hypothetical protein [Acinetobacter nosocomialis]MCG9289950.1 hypothetical protein [Acinetobacter nosocomialis]